MSGTGSLLLLALAAPPSLADVPPIDRARPHFYHAVAAGGPVTASWAAEPAGGDIALTLTVGGVANGPEVRKPDVKALVRGRFQVADRSDPPAGPGVVRFGWTLRPVPGGTSEVPGLPFAYYRPGFPDGRRFATAFAEPLLVSVPPPPPPVAVGPPLPVVPPAGPTLPGWAWLLPVGLVPPAVVVGTTLARRLFPSAARRAELRRVAAVRHALDALAAAPESPDPAGATAAAVRAYLRARPPRDPAGFVDLLARCDAVRFGPAGGDAVGLAAEAAALVRLAEDG